MKQNKTKRKKLRAYRTLCTYSKITISNLYHAPVPVPDTMLQQPLLGHGWAQTKTSLCLTSSWQETLEIIGLSESSKFCSAMTDKLRPACSLHTFPSIQSAEVKARLSPSHLWCTCCLTCASPICRDDIADGSERVAQDARLSKSVSLSTPAEAS